MTTDRQAIIEHHRRQRLEAETGNAGTLADVERAALAYERKIGETRKTLEDENRLTSEAIGQEISGLVVGWHGELPGLEKIIDEIESRSKFDKSPGLPERTEEHKEISAHFKTLKGDQRQEAIARAISGKDESLALALATEPPFTSTLTDFDRNLIIDRVAPDAYKEQAARASDITQRIAGARATLAEVTQRIGAIT